MNTSKISSLKSFIIKFLTSSIILALTAFFTPDFKINNLNSLIVAGLIITIIDSIFNLLLGKNKSSLTKGTIGFLVSIVILYGTQFLISNYSISLPSAIIGAIIYSMIASYSPNKKNNKKASQDSTTSWLTKLRG